MAKFTKIPADTFKQLQINAGIILKDFTPASGTFKAADQLGATTGGVTFTATPTFSDYGDDVDNCPKNMKELKRQESIEAKASGTFVTMSTAVAKSLIATADIDAQDSTKIVPRLDLADSDFDDLWIVGDYSDKNGEQKGGFISIHIGNFPHHDVQGNDRRRRALGGD